MSQQPTQIASVVQSAPANACQHPAAVGKRWGDSIDEDLQQDLQNYLDHWQEQAATGEEQGAGAGHAQRSGPFEKMTLSGAEVFWLAERMRNEQGAVPTLHLEGAMLREAHLEGANLAHAHLERAELSGAHLVRADLSGTSLVRANLGAATLSGADLHAANLSRAHLSWATLSGVDLRGANLRRSILYEATLTDANLSEADLAGANVVGGKLAAANLSQANLAGADLRRAKLAGANLSAANLVRAHLRGAHLTGAVLRTARLNVETDLSEAHLSTTTVLSDVIWNAVPLAQVAWETLPVLGDETLARQHRDADGTQKTAMVRLREYEAAARTYRLLAVALRSQGLNEHADRYAYRAQLMQRVVQRLRRQYLLYIGSLLLGTLAGYGYRPLRTLLWYLAVIGSFAFAYFQATHGLLAFGLSPSQIQPLPWYEALVLSVSSFHGRGFFQPVQSLGDPVAILAAIEAVFGLFIEVSFIATFTQRYFGK